MGPGFLAISFFISLAASVAAAADSGPCPGVGPDDVFATPNLKAVSQSVEAVSEKYDLSAGLTDDSWFRTKLLGGDNYGYAYGMQLVARKNRGDGTHLSFSYSSDLYSAPLEYLGQNPNGSYNEKQVFTNDTVYSVSLDNSDQRRILYYKVIAGAQVLDSTPSSNPLDASTQQLWFHRVTSNVRQLQDVSDGNGTRAGMLAGGNVGVQTHHALGDSTLVSGRADIGGVASGVRDASYKDANAEIAIRYKPGWVGARLALDLNDKFHPQGTERDATVSVSLLLGHSFEVGGDYTRYAGSLDNYALYNLPNVFTGKNDPTFKLWVKQGFGGSDED